MASPAPRPRRGPPAGRPRSACSAGSRRQKSPAKLLQRSSPSKGSQRDLRSALQQVDVGRTRGDFCAERFRVDCARLEAELRHARKALRDLQEQFVDVLEGKEQPHFAWLSLWHQRLLQAVAEAEKGSTGSSVPGWKDFKQLVLKSTEDVVESQQLVEEKVKALRSQQGDQKIQDEVLLRRKELAEVQAERKSCAEEVQRKKVQRQKLQQEMSEEAQRGTRDMTTLSKRREELQRTLEELTESYDASYRSCVMMRDEISALRKMRRPMPLHVYKLRMERLKAELVERQGPLMALRKVQRADEVEQQARHFKEMEELRAVQASLRKQLAQVEDHRRSAACRPIQKFWRQRKRRHEVARRRRYFEELQQGLDPPRDPFRIRESQGPPSASPVESIDENIEDSSELAEDLFGDVRQQILATVEDPAHVSRFTEDRLEDSPGSKSQPSEKSPLEPLDDEVEEAPLTPLDREVPSKPAEPLPLEDSLDDSPGSKSQLSEKSPLELLDDEAEEAPLDREVPSKPAEPLPLEDRPEDSPGSKSQLSEKSPLEPLDDEVEEAPLTPLDREVPSKPAEPLPLEDRPEDSPGSKSQLSEKSPLEPLDDEVEEAPLTPLDREMLSKPAEPLPLEDSLEDSPGSKSQLSEKSPLEPLDDEVEEAPLTPLDREVPAKPAEPLPSEDLGIAQSDGLGDSPGGTSQLTEKSSVDDDIEDDLVSPEITAEGQTRPHLVPKIALHPPEGGDGGDGEALTSPELPGEFLSMTFTEGARGAMEDSLLFTEDSPCSPDRFAAELADEETDEEIEPEEAKPSIAVEKETDEEIEPEEAKPSIAVEKETDEEIEPEEAKLSIALEKETDEEIEPEEAKLSIAMQKETDEEIEPEQAKPSIAVEKVPTPQPVEETDSSDSDEASPVARPTSAGGTAQPATPARPWAALPEETDSSDSDEASPVARPTSSATPGTAPVSKPTPKAAPKPVEETDSSDSDESSPVARPPPRPARPAPPPARISAPKSGPPPMAMAPLQVAPSRPAPTRPAPAPRPRAAAADDSDSD